MSKPTMDELEAFWNDVLTDEGLDLEPEEGHEDDQSIEDLADAEVQPLDWNTVWD